MSTSDLFSLILHSENEYFSSFNFSPFLASFLKGYVPVLRDPAQIIILRYFEKQTCCKDIVWSTLRAGNRAASYDPPLGFSKQGKGNIWSRTPPCLQFSQAHPSCSPDPSLFQLNVGSTFSSFGCMLLLPYIFTLQPAVGLPGPSSQTLACVRRLLEEKHCLAKPCEDTESYFLPTKSFGF